MTPEEQAKQATDNIYIRQGYFGGQAQLSSGKMGQKVTSIKYFDWMGTYQQILRGIQNGIIPAIQSIPQK